MTVRTIPLSRGYTALVDEADAESVLQHRWYIDLRRGALRYAITRAGRSTIRMHRLLVSASRGVHVDHRDGDGLNNQRSNLRIATLPQNYMNRHIEFAKKRNKHGFRGVAYVSRDRNYRGRLTIAGTSYYTKAFATPTEAAIAWDELAVKHYGEFASLNFPDLRNAPAVGSCAAFFWLTAHETLLTPTQD